MKNIPGTTVVLVYEGKSYTEKSHLIMAKGMIGIEKKSLLCDLSGIINPFNDCHHLIVKKIGEY